MAMQTMAEEYRKTLNRGLWIVGPFGVLAFTISFWYGLITADVMWIWLGVAIGIGAIIFEAVAVTVYHLVYGYLQRIPAPPARRAARRR